MKFAYDRRAARVFGAGSGVPPIQLEHIAQYQRLNVQRGPQLLSSTQLIIIHFHSRTKPEPANTDVYLFSAYVTRTSARLPDYKHATVPISVFKYLLRLPEPVAQQV